MKDMLTITQALNDMRDYYGLKEIKHVKLNMEEPNHASISFVSNKPKQLASITGDAHDMHTIPEEVTYVLELRIQISSIYKGE